MTRHISKLLILISFISCNMIDRVPSAEKIKKELIAHKDIRIDNYYWLNDKNDKNCCATLKVWPECDFDAHF